MTINDQIRAKRAELANIKGTGPDGRYTAAEADHIEALVADIQGLEARAAKSASDAASLIQRINSISEDEEHMLGAGQSLAGTKAASAAAARKGHAWATKSLEKVQNATSGMGLKSLFSGDLRVDDPILTEYSVMPELPTTLLDLIPVTGQNYGSRVDFFVQTVRTDNAAPVAMGDLKPTSIYSWDDDDLPFEVIAHISEPLNNVWASDYPKLVQIVGAEMAEGVRKALENQILNGSGVRPQLRGIFNTTGVTQVAYATDVLTTLRHAYTVMTGKGEAPTGYVLNPEDAEALELMREGGATGAFLDFRRVFPVAPVLSYSVPKGTALLADWRATQLTVREGVSTLMFTQHGDLAARNQFIIRSEGRYEFHIERPQAVAVVDLTAA